MKDKKDIFISYRRDGGSVYSALLYETLKNLGYSVFRDQQALGGGFFDDDIIAAVSESDDLILILSSHALDRCIEDNSDMVRLEISTALNSSTNIVPLLTSLFQWPDDLPADIDRVRYCNGFQIDDARLVTDFSDFLPRLLKSVPSPVVHSYRLISHMQRPKSSFVGRESVLDQIHECLREGNAAAIIGLGGSGKTEIAKAYCWNHRDDYKNIVFAGYSGSVMETFIRDDVFEIEGVHRLIDETVKMESREKYYQRKLDAFQKCITEETLVVFDNYEADSNDIDEHLYDFMFGKCNVLITSRSDISEYIPGFFVDHNVNKDEARKIFYSYYRKKQPNQKDPDVDALLQLVHYHVLSIELIAKHMNAAHLAPHEMLRRMKTAGIKALDSVVRGPHAEDRPGHAYDFIYSLFDLGLLSEESQNIMRNMTVMPQQDVSFGTFCDWTELEDYSVINDLIDRGWIICDVETDILSLHPVIRDIARDRLHPDENNCREIMNAAEREWTGILPAIKSRKWQTVVPTLDFIYSCLFSLQNEEGPLRGEVCAALADAYYHMTCYAEAYAYYLEICGRYMDRETVTADKTNIYCFERLIKCMTNGNNEYAEAYRLSLKVLDRAETLFGADSIECSVYAELRANVAADLGHYEESYDIRKRICELYEKDPDVPLARKLYAQSALSNCMIYLGAYQDAYDTRKGILKDLAENEIYRDAVSIAKSNLALAAVKLERYEEAETLIQEAIRERTGLKGEDDFYTLCMRTNAIVIGTLNGNTDAAINEGLKTVEREKELWGDDFDITIDTSCDIALAYYMNDQEEDALAMINYLISKEQTLPENLRPRVEIYKRNKELMATESDKAVLAKKFEWQTIQLMITTALEQ